jgi:uncharacterized tellurite resistance protein B-like protein
MSTRELQEQVVEAMHRWQRIETATIRQTAEVMMKTDNPIVHLVMEIIQRDSQMHHRVQQLVVESLTGTVKLDPEELGGVWELIEQHVQMEKETVTLAEQALAALAKRKAVVPEYLLNFLKIDEDKHVAMLEALAKIKVGMYPYG